MDVSWHVIRPSVNDLAFKLSALAVDFEILDDLEAHAKALVCDAPPIDVTDGEYSKYSNKRKRKVTFKLSETAADGENVEESQGSGCATSESTDNQAKLRKSLTHGDIILGANVRCSKYPLRQLPVPSAN